MNNDVLKAQELLREWLCTKNGIGYNPFKIVYTNKFSKDKDICYIFRFKRALISGWLIAIVYKNNSFSKLNSYIKETELKDAEDLLKTLEKINMKKTKKNKQAV